MTNWECSGCGLFNDYQSISCQACFKLAPFTPKRKKKLQELCVYGFIRKYCISSNMPNELVQLCLFMYLSIMDHWNTKIFSKGIQFDNDKNIVSIDGHYDWNTAFGTKIVTNGELYEWKFKVKHALDSKPAIFIGILPAMEISPEMDIFANDEKGVYALYTWNGYISGYNVSSTNAFNADELSDTILMCLDLRGLSNNTNCGSLSFEVSEGCKKTVSKNIDIDM